MIVDGEKYACDTCIRGHRVTQCQHIDRPLRYIGSKGRPVSQCDHCRSLRKSNSVHTRCKCAMQARNPTPGIQRCRCFQGEGCTCAHNKKQETTPGSRATGSLEPGTPTTPASSSTAAEGASCCSSDPPKLDSEPSASIQPSLDATINRPLASKGSCCGSTDTQSQQPTQSQLPAPIPETTQEHDLIGTLPPFADISTIPDPTMAQVFGDELLNFDSGGFGVLDPSFAINDDLCHTDFSMAPPADWNTFDYPVNDQQHPDWSTQNQGSQPPN